MAITDKYKGAEIRFDERDEVWCARLDEAQLIPNASLSKLKEAIDRAVKKSNKPVPCLKFTISKYNMEYRHVVVTSIDDRGDVWFTDNLSGRRNKEDISRNYDKIWFVICNDVNEKILLDIYDRTKRMEELEKQIRQLKHENIKQALTLTPYLRNANDEKFNINE